MTTEKKWLIFGAVGAMLYLMYQSAKQKEYERQILTKRLQQQNLMLPKDNSRQAIVTWITTIVAIFGNVAALWQPGGPFYKPPPEVKKELDALLILPPPPSGSMRPPSQWV
ncbi:MAG TPA: hypothetical protein PKD70_06305 [Saprospiraceae bacterium]|nr:hypothetical protein [Saprospiraceae bacterium]HMP13470.1 hypothetical protein [Saprospiraceae bacterium]